MSRYALLSLAWLASFGLALLSCDGRPRSVSEAPDALNLARLQFAELSVPDASLPKQFGDEIEIRLAGWRWAGEDGAAKTYWLELERPVPTDALLVDPAGRVLERSREDQRPQDARASSQHGLWKLSDRGIELSVPIGVAEPVDGSHRLRFRSVSEREESWNWRWSWTAGSEESDPLATGAAADFVRRQVTIDRSTRSGLLLPAPSRAEWELIVPPAAELQLRPGLLQPDWPGGLVSDGYELVIAVTAAAGDRLQRSWPIRSARFSLLRLDLGRFEGQSVRLQIETKPLGVAARDYAFLAEPVVASRRRDPRRVVIVFVDTLRPDRLGLYGHDRDTSPALDRFAEQAAVFDQARSVAPWTLPAVRSLLTGRQPEAWDRASTLPGALAERGFATAMLGANHFLLASFGSARDWGWHTVLPWGTAEEQTDRALDWLSETAGRDALLLVHYMDPHLPYDEPRAYRGRFGSTPAPAGLDSPYVREGVERVAATGDVASLRAHLLERYDANVRYVDDQLARLLEALSEHDRVIVLSDHGEEFFEHGGFEHGHALWDELVRVPLLMSGPGVVPARHAGPVSLLDVAPTVLEWLGAPALEADGISLLPQLRDPTRPGDPRRAIGFGRPLYDGEGWGVVRGDAKYVARHGYERRSRVVQPSRTGGLEGRGPESSESEVRFRAVRPNAREPLRNAMGPALAREFVTAWRVVASEAPQWPREDLVIEVRAPGGIKQAWWAPDPTRRSSVALDLDATSGRLVATWRAGYRGQRELFIQPSAVLASESPPQIAIRRSGRTAQPLRVPEPAEPGVLLRGEASQGRAVRLTLAVVPTPDSDASELIADDPVLHEQLRALGYLVGESAAEEAEAR